MEGEHAHTIAGVGLSAEPLSRIQHGDAREGKLLLSMRLSCPVLCFHMFYYLQCQHSPQCPDLVVLEAFS